MPNWDIPIRMRKHNSDRHTGRAKTFALSLAAGAIYPLGFAPFGWWPLALISVAIVFSQWHKLEMGDALWSSLFYGLAVYAVGVSWLYVSMVNFGGMAPVMAVIAVMIFALILSLFFIAPVAIFKLFENDFSEHNRFVILLPALWVGFEWLRGSIFSGFPWLQLGYSATENWFAGWASLSGVLGISFVLAVIAGLVAVSVLRKQRATYLIALTTLAVITLVSWGLNSTRWVNPVEPVLEVTLVQADISLSEKWNPDNRQNIMQTYLAASKTVDQTDLIIWPEGALPMMLDEIPASYLDALRGLSGELMFGAIERQTKGDISSVYNGLVMLKEEGLQVYRKQHLVPFGEYFPLQSILGWLFNALDIPMSNFSAGGAKQANMQLKGLKLLPTICYEDAFPEDWRQQVSDSNILLNISEDAWFGDSFAPHQRLQMARMRAIEFQRPVIRVSNSGLSTVIDAFGEVDAVSPQFQPALFNTPVYGTEGDTPYTKFGLWPLWGCLLLGLGFSIWQGRGRVRKNKN